MKREYMYYCMLLITAFPTFVFVLLSCVIINLYLTSRGHFWIRSISQGEIEVYGGGGSIYVNLWSFVFLVVMFVFFIFFLIMFLRELGKGRRAKEEERLRKEQERIQKEREKKIADHAKMTDVNR